MSEVGSAAQVIEVAAEDEQFLERLLSGCSPEGPS